VVPDPLPRSLVLCVRAVQRSCILLGQFLLQVFLCPRHQHTFLRHLDHRECILISSWGVRMWRLWVGQIERRLWTCGGESSEVCWKQVYVASPVSGSWCLVGFSHPRRMHECAVLLPTSARVDISGRRGKQGLRGRSHRKLGSGESEEAPYFGNWVTKHVQRPR
jgi:hypothetical protein